LYSFRQKFCVVVLYETKIRLAREVLASAISDALDFIGAKLGIDDRPDNVVTLHGIFL
jgi:hypothetical protein